MIQPEDSPTRTYLYWIPLGAGGSGFVRLNGRVYEWIKAMIERRATSDLYHTALQVHTSEGRFVVETMWPSPDRDLTSRGVVYSGAVGSPLLGRMRVFRYEVRVWRDGELPDAGVAVGGPRLICVDPAMTQGILDSSRDLPDLVWGRDELGVGDMWNSNSVISWLLAGAGVSMDSIHPPGGGRAPGWAAGLAAAGYVPELSSPPTHERKQPVEGGR